MSTAERLLRFEAVAERVPYSRSVIYAKVARKEFPAPIKMGARAVGWVESEINAYVERLIADARGGPTDGA